MRQVTKVFGETYALLYDATYRSKDYEVECANLLSLAITRGLPAGGSILDVGCGTGKHASIIADQGFQVVGVDRSSFMLDIARAAHGNKIQFYDTSWISQQTHKFDFVYSIFDVLSYQVTPQAAREFLLRLSNMATLGATIIVDAWHLPGLMSEPPKSKEVAVEVEGMGLYKRRVTPSIDWLTGVTTLQYEINHGEERNFQVVNETHKMKAFTMSELAILAEDCGLDQLDFLVAPVMDRPVGSTDWHICMVSTKTH